MSEYDRVKGKGKRKSVDLDTSVKTTGDISAETKGEVKRFSAADQRAFAKAKAGPKPMKPGPFARKSEMDAYRLALAAWDKAYKAGMAGYKP